MDWVPLLPTQLSAGQLQGPTIEASLIITGSYIRPQTADPDNGPHSDTPVPISAAALASGASTTSLIPQGTSIGSPIQDQSSLAVLNPLPDNPMITIDSETLSQDSEGQYVIGSPTLMPVTPIMLSSGTATTPVVLQITNSNAEIVLGSNTATYAPGPTNQAFTIGDQAITPISNNKYIIGTQTLTQGTPITIGPNTAPTPVAIQTTNGQTIIAIGSSSTTLVAAAAVTTPPSFSVGNEIVTANS